MGSVALDSVCNGLCCPRLCVQWALLPKIVCVMGSVALDSVCVMGYVAIDSVCNGLCCHRQCV